jgi:hypothetical protein
MSLIQQTSSYMTEQFANESLPAEARRNYIVYGATLAFLTLGIFTDIITKGRNLFTLMAALIMTKVLFVLAVSIYFLVSGTQLIESHPKTVMFLFGYSSCLVTTLEL